MSIFKRVMGPRVPHAELKDRWPRYAAPTVALSVARVLLLCSLFLPYWTMELQAPQYPKGLHLTAFQIGTPVPISELEIENSCRFCIAVLFSS